jgi:hypothetical protein
MEYEWCRVRELVRHAADGDAKAQALLVEEVRSYLGDLIEHYGAGRQAAREFAQQVLARARRDFGQFWAKDEEFGGWMDGILQREVEAACRHF